MSTNFHFLFWRYSKQCQVCECESGDEVEMAYWNVPLLLNKMSQLQFKPSSFILHWAPPAGVAKNLFDKTDSSIFNRKDGNLREIRQEGMGWNGLWNMTLVCLPGGFLSRTDIFSL